MSSVRIYLLEFLHFNVIFLPVRNNLKLEKITCEAISDKTLKEYEELKIKEAGNDKINTSIEIVIKVES